MTLNVFCRMRNHEDRREFSESDSQQETDGVVKSESSNYSGMGLVADSGQREASKPVQPL